MFKLGQCLTVVFLLHFCGNPTSVVSSSNNNQASLMQKISKRVLSEKELLSLAKKRVDPIYPQEANAIITRPRYGVFVYVEINSEGKVIEARAIRGSSLEKDAAIEAAKSWEFTPIFGNGVSSISGVINFGLPEGYIRKDPSHPIRSYEEEVRKNPSSWLAHSRLGTAYILHNQLEKAVTEYERALSLQPESPVILYGLGITYRDLGQFQEAAIHLRRVIQNKPDFVEAIYALSWVLRDMGKIEEATALLQQAIKVRGDVDVKNTVYSILYSMYEKSGQEEKAILMLEERVKVDIEIRSLDPEDVAANPVYDLQKIADYYEKKERYEEAIKAYQRIVDFQPISPAAFRASIDMASLHKKLGRQSEAIAICERLLNYVNSNPIRNSQGEADEMRGRIYMEMDRDQDAILYFKKAAAKKTSNSIRPNEYLYDLYLKVGNQKEAAKQKEIIRKFYEEWERPMREGNIIRVKP